MGELDISAFGRLDNSGCSIKLNPTSRNYLIFTKLAKVGNKTARTPMLKPKTGKKKKKVKEEVDIKSESQKSVGKVSCQYLYCLELILVII